MPLNPHMAARVRHLSTPEREAAARMVADDTTFTSTGPNQHLPYPAPAAGAPVTSSDARVGTGASSFVSAADVSSGGGGGKKHGLGLHPVLLLAGGLVIAWLIVRSK